MLLIQAGIYLTLACQGFTAKAITTLVALALALVLAVAIAGTGAIGVAVAAAAAGILAVAFAGALALDRAIATALVIAGAALLLSLHVAWRIHKEDEKFEPARSLGLWLGVIGGTSFKDADLSDADFSGATLSNCDFSRAIVTRTGFKDAKQLKRARLKDTILNDKALRDLLVTGQGHQQNYRGKNLQGANLAGADLRGADFTEADISGAVLGGADLTGANLTKTQALGADFRGGTLTRACLEAWNIDSTTRLEGAICDYVYLLNQQRERRPSSGEFGSGEFTKLFQEVLDTVDLIFRNGIDWRAFITAFKKLQVENEGKELTVQRIENKGDGVVVVRVSVPPDANKEKIHSEFTQHYEMNLKLLEAELKAKDEKILIYQQSANMLAVINTLANRPININAGAKAITHSNGGELRMGDTYNVGQAGTVGPGGHAHDINFNQVWNESSGTIDIAQLARELKELRDSLSKEASEPDHRVALEEVASAEKAAGEGNVSKALEHLKKAGSWVWDAATKIGIGVATAAAKTALGS